MKLEIYSDVVCPWCYIGHRRLATALQDYVGADDVEVSFKPFQLDPDAGPDPIPLRDAYVAKFGTAEEADELIGQVQAAAETAGLDLHLGSAQRVNTFDAHRLIGWALSSAGPVVQADLVERVMAAYFTQGRNIADHAELAALAKEVGLEGAEGYLASDAGVAELKAELGEGRALGLTSVPTFVFEGRWAVAGAQTPEVLQDIMAQIELALVGGSGGGGCCGGGGGGCACGS